MVKFYEERFPDCLQYTLSIDDGFMVDQQATSGGIYTRLKNPFPLAGASVALNQTATKFTSEVYALYKKVGGTYAGFRFRNPYEFSTNNFIEPPTYADSPLLELSGGTFQLTKYYESPIVSDTARRYIRKPVAATVLLGVNNLISGTFPITNDHFTVDTTKGELTIPAFAGKSITNITQATQAVVSATSANVFAGDSLYFSGVGGMTEINGLRALVLNSAANQITIDLDTTGFTAYTSGGIANLLIQDTETYTAGCEFDLAMKFDSRIEYNPLSKEIVNSSVQLIEFHNPDPQLIL